MSRRSEFVRRVNEIWDEQPRYRIGGDGRNGICDCVGLPIGALRRMGIAYAGEHSSNWLPRREAVELWKIESVRQLTAGDVVLKARDASDPRYSLPKRFQSYRDKLDYYHAGVVVATDPLRIRHISGPGALEDTSLGRWSHAMLMGQLQENGGKEGETMEEKTLFRATVITKDDPLNLRSAPETGEVIAHIPIGATVDVLEGMRGGSEWMRVRWNGLTGWAHGGFLRGETVIVPNLPEDPESSDGMEICPEDRDSTALIREDDGAVIVLAGSWHVADD